jgi:hypothetical protein
VNAACAHWALRNRYEMSALLLPTQISLSTSVASLSSSSLSYASLTLIDHILVVTRLKSPLDMVSHPPVLPIPESRPLYFSPGQVWRTRTVCLHMTLLLQSLLFPDLIISQLPAKPSQFISRVFNMALSYLSGLFYLCFSSLSIPCGQNSQHAQPELSP